MRSRWFLVATLLAGMGSGCAPFALHLARNVAHAPIRSADTAKLEHRVRKEAKAAWSRVRADPGTFSTDYADGFQQGFADYLLYGGNGQPPAVPPFRYRLTSSMSPEGHRDIADWYEGFRHGATEARASGLREQVVLPLASPPINAVEPHGRTPLYPATPLPVSAAQAPPPIGGARSGSPQLAISPVAAHP